MTNQELKQLKAIRGVGPKRLKSIIQKLNETNKTIDDLFKMSEEAIKSDFGLPINVAKSIADNNNGADTKSPQEAKASNKRTPSQSDNLLEEKNIQIITDEDVKYSERLKRILGDKAPSRLYVWGNLDLLNQPSVGFCGSRNASDKGLEITHDTAQQIAELGWVVVSGHARGVDTTAHRAALENGAGTIIVAAEGILDFKLRRELKNIAKPEQVLIISEFIPTAKWNVGYAMQRNKTIIGLSDVMILVEARTEGGTFAAGKDALAFKMPLFVVEYQSPGISASGNQYFIERGAESIKKNKITGKANLETLKAEVEHRQKKLQQTPSEKLNIEQMKLNLG